MGTNKGDIHFRAKDCQGPNRKAWCHKEWTEKQNAAKCQDECRSFSGDDCYAFVYHPFGNCKILKKSAFAASRIMKSGKGHFYMPANDDDSCPSWNDLFAQGAPTPKPTAKPTRKPTAKPTRKPTRKPTAKPQAVSYEYRTKNRC